jgi:putative transposase
MCEVLGVSKSGFYAWTKRKPSLRAQRDALLLKRIRCIHKDSRETYGSPRIHFELKDQYRILCGRKRVARLMAAHGIRGCCRRRRHWTTRKADGATPSQDLLNRDFTADAPNKRWVADITYVRTWQGFVHVAFVLDLFSRRIVGWSMADHLRTELVLDALGMAVLGRRPDGGLIHHSDPLNAVSTRAWRSVSAAERLASSRPWVRSEMPTTTPRRSRLSLRSSASSSTGDRGLRATRRSLRCSTS